MSNKILYWGSALFIFLVFSFIAAVFFEPEAENWVCLSSRKGDMLWVKCVSTLDRSFEFPYKLLEDKEGEEWT